MDFHRRAGSRHAAAIVAFLYYTKAVDQKTRSPMHSHYITLEIYIIRVQPAHPAVNSQIHNFYLILIHFFSHFTSWMFNPQLF